MFRLLANKIIGTLYSNNSSFNIPTGSWLRLLTAIPLSCSAVEINNPSGSILQFSIGTVGHESDTGKLLLYTVPPGGSSGVIPFNLPNGSPLSVQALDTAVTSGYLIINFFG